MADTGEGTPDLGDDAIERIARAIVAESLSQSRRIDIAGKRINAKPRRPAGYTYIYLERVIGLGLTGTEWDVVFALASRADQKGIIAYSVPELCGQLDLERSNFHRALRRAVTVDVFRRIGKNTLQLNPRMLWHGSSTSQVSQLADEIGSGLRTRLTEEGIIE